MFSAQFLVEVALTALRDSHREAAWVARAALDHAMRHALGDDYTEAMELANRAIEVRNAIAQRIAMLEPEVGQAVAASIPADQGDDAKPLH